MGDQEQTAASLADQLQEQVEHHIAARLVQAAGGFIGQHQQRSCGQGPADGHTLLLATGELFRVALQQRCQAKALGQIADPGGIMAGGQTRLKRQIGRHAQAADEVVLLEHQPDALAAPACQFGLAAPLERHALDQDPPAVRPFQTGHQMQQGALAAAGLTHQRQTAAARQLQIHAT